MDGIRQKPAAGHKKSPQPDGRVIPVIEKAADYDLEGSSSHMHE
jgi:hypothetical protein